jgi:uncharacterized protein
LDIPFAAVALRHGDAKIQIYGAGKFACDSPEMSLENALLASTAAPTYFPSVEYNKTSLLDGGLVANSPELLGIYLIKNKTGVNIENISMLGVGTASSGPGVFSARSDNRGTIRWVVSRRGVIQLTLAAQESLARDVTRTLLGDRYYKLDNNPVSTQARKIGNLDNTSEDAVLALQSLAEEAWAEFLSDPRSERYTAI